MNFEFSREQNDIRELAGKIFDDKAAPDTLADFETGHARHDESLWSDLASAQLLGVALPESCGGMGFGVMELCVLMEQAGRTLAPVQLLPTLAMAAAPIAAHGSEAIQAKYLKPVVEGSLVMTAALVEGAGGAFDPPSTEAVESGSGVRLGGHKLYVPAAGVAGAILVSASASGSLLLAIVAPSAEGVTVTAHETTSGEYEYELELKNVQVEAEDILARGEEAEAALDTLRRWSVAALCATELGISERAVRMTAEYTAQREQFGKPIGSFQAVSQRAADAYIDVESIRATTWQAAWRLGEGLSVDRELAIAKYWASEGGHRACYAAQHLHGGMGVDKDYPLHRYYLESRRLELTFGGANTHLAELGRRLAG